VPRQSDARIHKRREHRSFLVLPENRMAYTAAMQVLKAGAGCTSPALTVSGPSGVGKSHLVQQFVRAAYSAGSAVVVQIAASEFAAGWEDAVRRKQMQEFHDAHANIDCLACEDLHAIRSKPGAQQALVSLMDVLLPQGGRVLLSCRRPPGEVPGLSRRLIDRCHGGVCVSLDPPDRASRVKLLQLFADEQQALLPPDVVNLLADSGWQLPRELQGLVSRLVQSAGRRQSAIDLPLAAALLRDEPQRQAGRVDAIATEVARQFGVALHLMRSQSRHASHVVPRQAAMYLSRELSGTPYAEIGRYFDGRNHSTVVHACQRFQTLLEGDQRVASLVENVRDRLPAASGCRKHVERRSIRRRQVG
jgi:chromosomal replication initiator protein